MQETVWAIPCRTKNGQVVSAPSPRVKFCTTAQEDQNGRRVVTRQPLAAPLTPVFAALAGVNAIPQPAPPSLRRGEGERPPYSRSPPVARLLSNALVIDSRILFSGVLQAHTTGCGRCSTWHRGPLPRNQGPLKGVSVIRARVPVRGSRLQSMRSRIAAHARPTHPLSRPSQQFSS